MQIVRGNILTGRRVIDGKHVYFYDDDYGQYKGIQAKDKLIILGGKTYYYLPGSGNRADNVTLTINHVTYYFDNDGLAISFDSHLQVTMNNYPTQKEVDQLSTSLFISSITVIQIESKYELFLNNYDYLVKTCLS